MACVKYLNIFKIYLFSKRNDSRQQSNQNVRINTSFVGLVKDYHAVSTQLEILRQCSKIRNNQLNWETTLPTQTPYKLSISRAPQIVQYSDGWNFKFDSQHKYSVYEVSSKSI